MTMTPRRLRYQGVTVPYITAWSKEQLLPVPPLLRRPGPGGGVALGFQAESSYDRDTHGALRMRMAIARGKGVPHLARVHALRQRRAMLDLLCQVCTRPCLEVDGAQRYLFLVGAAEPVREGERTVSPPVCPPCAIEAAQACPHLRRACVLAWVKRPESWGVTGDVYDPTTLERIATKQLVHVPYYSPGINWTIGAHTILSLHEVTPASWSEVHHLAQQIPQAPAVEVAA
ncbi:hypothetical protein ACF053_29535 [Streptomyces kanasensis]|uniref:hypothetical protein n=1 Tax=Streptomyces kanasensis TaxID=936756 RepID=UPI0036FC2E86